MIGLSGGGGLKKDVYRRLIEIGDYYEDRQIQVATRLTEVAEFENTVARELKTDLLALWKQRGLTVVFVTHSIHEAVFLSTRVVMMAARPGRIVEEFLIDEPYPRKPEFMVSPEFARHAKQLQDSLHRASRDTSEDAHS